ncbi:ribosomal protein S18 [Sodiomyces alkalinus F11]|uniref:Small ribosomal subunit protein bS18m n=1 Tax=Sodiomyces alkalinus (strain CBS 110278 / VKM F-3762 / F11) TaxID=1314773 RepID=A0A3N2Q3Y3_SODAK|nr:ribosomal protein S18 [Sodiomyces alkalinus F11]ROT41460.1 ribosomal protein S18 [Sodiomyces alkalinus F11]
MPPRLPFIQSGSAPSSFLRRLARPLSTTPALSQYNPASNILTLDRQPAAQSAERVQNLVREKARAQSEAQQAKRRADLQLIQERKVSDDYMRQMPRRWQTGDVYAPHDLNPHQLAKWKRRGPSDVDVVDLLNVNPLDMYRNFAMISEYVTSTGQINSTRYTGLRPRNQRRMAKAIRRAMGMGIHPSVHYHPELLKKWTR